MDERTVFIIGGAAVALVLVGFLLRSLPDWPQRIGNLLPGWPWW